MMTLEQLPPKGVKREQAILELGKEEANGELLFQLVNTEKGKCKTAAQKALAQLEYGPAAPAVEPHWVMRDCVGNASVSKSEKLHWPGRRNRLLQSRKT